jgi:hypothetical protein
MRFLTGLLLLGMSLWTTQAYEIGLVWAASICDTKRSDRNYANASAI